MDFLAHKCCDLLPLSIPTSPEFWSLPLHLHLDRLQYISLSLFCLRNYFGEEEGRQVGYPAILCGGATPSQFLPLLVKSLF